MSLFDKNYLTEVAAQCSQTCEDLEKTYNAVIDDSGDVRDIDEIDLIRRILDNIRECGIKMDAVSKSLADISKRQRVKALLQTGKKETGEKSNYENPKFYFDEKYLREAVNLSGWIYEQLKGLFDQVLNLIGKVNGRDDNELLYQNLKSIEECRDRMYTVNDSLVEINERLENIELSILYGPFSDFDDE